MDVDYIVIGQGISGTFLSYYLQKENKSFIVVDDPKPSTPSRIAAGIINPVTGRRMVTVWMADEMLPFCWDAYQAIGIETGLSLISQKSIIDFFPSPFMRESFIRRIETRNSYLHSYPEQNHFNKYFNYSFGCGEIRPVYVADLASLLAAWRINLINKHCLREEMFAFEELKITEEQVQYKDINAASIIFCDGADASDNPFFNLLPFAYNKGEALLVSIPELPAEHIYKKNLSLVPMAEEAVFWCGSTYQWEYDHKNPTDEFRVKTEQLLKEWIKIPFTIEDHQAGIRPATIERRPFVGMHPIFTNVGILNGMGTKGCSLAPYFAHQLTDHLLYNMEIHSEADVRRFKGVLSRG